jgi:hypothetical protein
MRVRVAASTIATPITMPIARSPPRSLAASLTRVASSRTARALSMLEADTAQVASRAPLSVDSCSRAGARR